MEPIAIVTLLALLEYFGFGMAVARARSRSGVEAPATVGDPTFERTFRVQQNTLEQLAIFVPSLWTSAYFWGVPFATLLGVTFMLGRVVYGLRYVADPESRRIGVLINFGSNVILLLGALSGGVVSFWE